MASYKDPSFQERTALAKEARLKALSKFQAKPVMDESTIDENKAPLLVYREAAQQA
jgi:hypothetical protein